jgi:hypothetical protein
MHYCQTNFSFVRGVIFKCISNGAEAIIEGPGYLELEKSSKKATIQLV